jgi:DNA-directed RNA polymerase specialized sigma24 family protein
MLREFGELSYAEIAETLGASLAEVKVWIHRGRTRLTQLLDRDGQFVGKKCNDL